MQISNDVLHSSLPLRLLEQSPILTVVPPFRSQYYCEIKIQHGLQPDFEMMSIKVRLWMSYSLQQ